uniref:ABCB19 n=1 Tax=Arundo donax TaxID=35708 RepID=A0A0A9E132_ARUDO
MGAGVLVRRCVHPERPNGWWQGIHSNFLSYRRWPEPGAVIFKPWSIQQGEDCRLQAVGGDKAEADYSTGHGRREVP